MLAFSYRGPVMSIDIHRFSHFFGKKYSYLVCLLLVYVAKYGLRGSTQDAIYDAWRKNKPSRSTFTNLLKDLEQIGIIERRQGRKKSSVEIKVLSNQLIYFVGLKPLEEFIPSNCWVFQTGTFDPDAFQMHYDFQSYYTSDKNVTSAIQEQNNFGVTTKSD